MNTGTFSEVEKQPTEETKKITEPELFSPMFKGYIRGMCERLYGGTFRHASAYGMYFVLDSMVRNGERVYIVALNKRFKPLERWLAPVTLLSDASVASEKIDSFAKNLCAEYVIVAKNGRSGGFASELAFANILFESLKNTKLYDYITVADDSFRSYMERLR